VPLIGDAGGVGPIFERPIPFVVVERHVLGRVEAGDDDVQQAVVVEVVHDGAARLVEPVDADEVADVAELADVHLGVEKAIHRQQVLRIDFVRKLAECHVGHVQQPARLEVVGELFEVFGEMPDRQPRTGGVGVDRGRRDRDDAGTLAAALDAIVVLAPAEAGHTLVVDDGVKPVRGQVVRTLDVRPQPFQHPVRFLRFALVVQEAGPPDLPDDFVRAAESCHRQVRVELLQGLESGVLPHTGDLGQGGVGLPRGDVG
jgi:hypothetical protein